MPALPAINNLRTVLTAQVLISDTSVAVSSTAGWPSQGVLSIDEEVIYYTGIVANTFTGCSRGYDDTAAAAHTLLDLEGNPTVVNLRIIAKHAKDATYQDATATKIAAGGIAMGTMFPDRMTVQEMFDLLLHPSADPTYKHIQSVASTTWTIVHNMGRYPVVKILDTSNIEVEADVTHTDANTVVISSSIAFAGTAYLF